MDTENVNNISLDIVVDEGSNRVIFAELDEDSSDVLFSFLTMPMGTIIRLTCNRPPAVDIGGMNNLYESVKKFDVKRLRTETCKTMLLYPQSAAKTHCGSLKLKIDGGEPTKYFMCSAKGWDCPTTKFMLLSHHSNLLCGCGSPLSYEMTLSDEKLISAIRDGGVFVKGLNRLLLSDDLQVMPPSTTAALSLLSKLGVMESSTVEVKTLNLGENEVLDLLKCSLVSKTPLTESLLKHKPVPGPQLNEDYLKKVAIQSQIESEAANGEGKICVNIIVSKSRKVVCYAEAGEKFVNLLFSYLTVPLGYIVKEMRGSPSKGCIDHLYTSIQDLDAEMYMKSDEHKAILLNPKVAPGFRYENQPLGIEEASHPLYYLDNSSKRLNINRSSIPSGTPVTVLTVKDPYKEATNGGGFVHGPALFTVFDNMIITPISPVSGISALKKLKVPFNDVEERIVHVGNEEATRLLVASFVSESALTDAFIKREPNKG